VVVGIRPVLPAVRVEHVVLTRRVETAVEISPVNKEEGERERDCILHEHEEEMCTNKRRIALSVAGFLRMDCMVMCGLWFGGGLDRRDRRYARI